MSEERKHEEATGKPERQPYRVRLPGFVRDEEIGLGDMIQHVTSTIGIRSCDDCAKRAAMLNRWMVFSGRRSSK